MLPLLLSVLLNGAIVPSHHPSTCPHPGPKGGCAHKPRCLPGTPSATPAASVR
ncbi:MAG: hypothetical protein L6R48_22540 [Planctomycetes bacterium]|nr:hypothetical protein [Planctomycetota bacterium]